MIRKQGSVCSPGFASAASKSESTGSVARDDSNSVVSVVGAGAVGSSIANALLLQRVAHVKLVDVDEQRLEGEVLDLQDAFSSIEQASLQDAGPSSDLIVLTAGAAQKPGQSRMDLVDTNVGIVKQICDGLGPIAPDTTVMVVANPCDVLTYFAQEYLSDRLPQSQVIGSGTVLDTNRLRVALAYRFNVNLSSLHTYVLGEHGDTQFPALSCSRVGGIPLEQMPGFDADEFRQIADQSKRKAYSIIQVCNHHQENEYNASLQFATVLSVVSVIISCLVTLLISEDCANKPVSIWFPCLSAGQRCYPMGHWLSCIKPKLQHLA